MADKAVELHADRTTYLKEKKRSTSSLSFILVECLQTADVISTEGVDCTCAGDDLRWHQVLVIVRLALHALEPTVELLICFNAQRHESLTLMMSTKIHRRKPEADERRYDTRDSGRFPPAGGRVMCPGFC